MRSMDTDVRDDAPDGSSEAVEPIADRRHQRRVDSRRRGARYRSSTSTTSPSSTATFRAVRDITLPIREQRDHRADRPLGLREDHVPPLSQPDERPDRGRPGRGQDPVPRRRPVRRTGGSRSRSVGGSGWCSRSRIPSRSRSTTTSPSARGSPDSRANMDELVEESLRRAALWDEVKQEAEGIGDGALRRAAAAPLHRARDRDEARRDPDGRAVLVPRPDRHRRRSRT